MRLSGQNCLVTGANSGLGLVVSKKLATNGANTVLLCRNKERGEDAVQEIKKEVSNASVDLMICDLASMRSIRNFIEDFKGKYSTLDILYNNAAAMKKERTVTEDGFELMFQVNYLAAFMLMNSFIDLLKKGSSPYIINNGRPSEKLRLDFDDLQFSKKYHMYNSFFHTKLCLLFASLELSRKSASDGITVTMIDPGPFKSDLVREVPLVGWFKNLFSAPVDKAADNILYHIDSDEAKSKNGKLFKEKQEYPLTSYWKDKDLSQRLWAITEELINKALSH